MEYKANPEAAFENINRALGDAIQTAIIGGLFYACKQYKKKPKLMRVQHSSTACPLCQSPCGEFSVDEFETSKASEFHRGCRCKLIVSWKEESNVKPKEHKRNDATIINNTGEKLKPKEIKVGEIYTKRGDVVEVVPRKNNSHTPDFMINGVSAEVKQPIGDKNLKRLGKQTINHQFEYASKQSSFLVLDLSEVEKYGKKELDKAINKAISVFKSNNYKEIKKLDIIYEGEIHHIA